MSSISLFEYEIISGYELVCILLSRETHSHTVCFILLKLDHCSTEIVHVREHKPDLEKQWGL